jgi:hypothetical protein
MTPKEIKDIIRFAKSQGVIEFKAGDLHVVFGVEEQTPSTKKSSNLDINIESADDVMTHYLGQ